MRSQQAWLAVLLALPARAGTPSAAAQEESRRIAFSLEIAAAEYGKAVSGAQVDKVEQREALEFLSQAGARFKRLAVSEGLDDFSRGPVEAELAALEAEARAASGDPGAFRGRAARAAADVAEAFGASARLVPPRPPSAAAGAETFRMHCAMCHGAKGDGRGPALPGLNPKPARFTEARDVRRTPPAQYFRVVSVGVDGTAMTAFDDRLSEEERWDVVAHLYSFTLAEPAARGRELLARRRLPPEFRDQAALAQTSQDELHSRLAAAFPEDSPDARADLAAALRLGGPAEAARAADAGLAPVLAAVKAELPRAVALAAAGDAPAAANAAADAYLRFEPAEPAARALDAGGTKALEEAFTALRGAARAGEKDLAPRTADIAARLDALAAPRAARGSWGAFAQSFLIIAREGFEAMLVLAAIAALLARAGRKSLLATFYSGAWAGVAASLATAWALEALFAVTPVQREALEGLVLCAAAATLLTVAYWMVDAAAMGDWNRWLRERLGKATGEEGGAWALASVSFLAVYREGFETVLFYKALWAMDTSQSPALAAGFAAGLAALAVLFVLMRRGTLKLPLRPFFLGTGALLYWLAFTFVGRAPAVLQAAGWLPETPTPWSLTVPWAGVNPSWESAGPQLAVAALGLAGALTLRARSRRGGRS
ncbi:c-type cytochrome [bacterium]|nr:MAG: c-type cytochrome [bacterium]